MDELKKEYEKIFPDCIEYISFGKESVCLDGDFTWEKLNLISNLLYNERKKHYESIIQERDELINYIVILSKEISSMSSHLQKMGWKSALIEEGEEQRKKMKSIGLDILGIVKSKLNKDE